jgi:hypothetical protein
MSATKEQIQNWLNEYRKSAAYKKDLDRIFNGEDVQGQVAITGIKDYAAEIDNPAIWDALSVINDSERDAGHIEPGLHEIRVRLRAIREAQRASMLMDVPVEAQDQIMDNLENRTLMPGDEPGYRTLWREEEEEEP